MTGLQQHKSSLAFGCEFWAGGCRSRALPHCLRPCPSPPVPLPPAQVRLADPEVAGNPSEYMRIAKSAAEIEDVRDCCCIDFLLPALPAWAAGPSHMPETPCLDQPAGGAAVLGMREVPDSCSPRRWPFPCVRMPFSQCLCAAPLGCAAGSLAGGQLLRNVEGTNGPTGGRQRCVTHRGGNRARSSLAMSQYSHARPLSCPVSVTRVRVRWGLGVCRDGSRPGLGSGAGRDGRGGGKGAGAKPPGIGAAAQGKAPGQRGPKGRRLCRSSCTTLHTIAQEHRQILNVGVIRPGAMQLGFARPVQPTQLRAWRLLRLGLVWRRRRSPRFQTALSDACCAGSAAALGSSGRAQHHAGK